MVVLEKKPGSDRVAQGFAAMGSKARLQVIKVVIRAGNRGIEVGEVQRRTKIAPSTLAHHLKFLADAGLLSQERSGRTTINRAEFEQLEALAGFILNECCADELQIAGNENDEHDRDNKCAGV